MKTIYALLFTLSLFFLGNSVSFAGSISCINNFSPVFTLSPACGSTINAQVGVPVTISGTISDANLGDIVTVTNQGIPAGATTTPSLPASGNNIGFTFTWTPSAAYGGMTIPVVFAAIDLCGATSVCFFSIQVTCAPLTVTCPGDTSLTAGLNCSAVFTYIASASSASGLTDFTATPASGSTFTVGTTTVVAIATDVCGNTATCSFDVTVESASPPTITCPSDISTTANLGSGCGATVPFILSASSPVGISTLTSNAPNGARFPVGKTTVTATATDNCGSTSTCSWAVTVASVPPPTITCPSDISATANFGLGCGANVPFILSASSPIGISTLTSNAPNGARFPIGKTTVTATATDNCGSTSTCSFAVTVESAPPPTLTCPSNISAPVESGTSCGATVPYIIIASSPIGISDLTIHAPPGAFFPIGTTTVTATATDACGSTSSCSWTVTVESPPPPTITCPGNMRVLGACQSVIPYNVQTSGGVPPLNIVLTPPSGSTFTTGVTTVNASVTDGCGRTASCSFTVRVIPDPPPVIVCPANITRAVNNNSCGAYVFFEIGLEDVNDYATIISTPPSGSAFPVGTTTVNATATDECGQSSSCSFTVTVTGVTVNAGPDVSTVFGYPSTQTATRTAVASGGTPPYSYRWTLNRPLKCNQVNSAGDELFTGGTCTNNICPGTGSVTTAAPACTGNATINATLLADATACVTVTDANGCTASECFDISAVDGRCFSGASGKKKTKVCHRTGSATNPWIQICVDKGAIAAHLSHNPDDKVGPCPSGVSRTAYMEEDETFVLYPNPVGSELTLDFGSEGIRAVQLFNTMGKLLFETTSDWEQLKMDMTGYAKGIYFISVRDEDNIVTVKKFVKM